MPRQRKPTKKPVTRVRIEAEPLDEIDWERFGWALLQYCRLKLEADGDGTGRR